MYDVRISEWVLVVGLLRGYTHVDPAASDANDLSFTGVAVSAACSHHRGKVVSHAGTYFIYRPYTCAYVRHGSSRATPCDTLIPRWSCAYPNKDRSAAAAIPRIPGIRYTMCARNNIMYIVHSHTLRRRKSCSILSQGGGLIGIW